MKIIKKNKNTGEIQTVTVDEYLQYFKDIGNRSSRERLLRQLIESRWMQDVENMFSLEA
jgi:hypothetical protein